VAFHYRAGGVQMRPCKPATIVVPTVRRVSLPTTGCSIAKTTAFSSSCATARRGFPASCCFHRPLVSSAQAGWPLQCFPNSVASKKPPASKAAAPAPQVYNKDQWISSFEDAMVKLRPHMGLRVLTTIGLMAWNQKGTKGIDPQLAALEWSKSMDKAK